MQKYLTELDLRVEKLVWRGRGLARTEQGKAVILEPGVLPGEEVRVRILKEKKDHVLARAEEILEPNPNRREHPCMHGAECGACPFAIISNRLSLQIKKEILLETLARQLSPDFSRNAAEMLQIVPSKKAWRYRYRGQVHVLNGEPHFMQSSTNVPVLLRDCKVFARPLNRFLRENSSHLPDGRHHLAASPGGGPAAWSVENKRLNLPLDPWGLSLSLGAGSFFQANWKQNLELVSLVAKACSGYARVADLYAGSGNFSLPLASKGHDVLAVEGFKKAVQEGRDNAGANNLDKVNFVRADLSRRDRNYQEIELFFPQCAVVDPPRSGGGKAVGNLGFIQGLERIVWISCDIVNSCRDLKPLVREGWELSDIYLVDMFPQTWHMEVVMILDRKRAES
ncbi:MAG: TRAM domain-containing protein [Desulfovibrionales bacterium]